MRLSAEEKMEVIRPVEGSDLSIRRTLRELGVSRSTFYAWYQQHAEQGFDGLVPRKPARRRRWSRMPMRVREHVVATALEHTEAHRCDLAGGPAVDHPVRDSARALRYRPGAAAEEPKARAAIEDRKERRLSAPPASYRTGELRRGAMPILLNARRFRGHPPVTP